MTYLKQQLDTLQTETIQKLQLFKEIKLSTLKEQEDLLKESQDQIDECYKQFYDNLGSMTNIQDRKGINLKIVDDTLSQLKVPAFQKTGVITEISSEMTAVQQVSLILYFVCL